MLYWKEAGYQDSIIRTGNAVDTIKNSGIELEKLSYQIANWNRVQAQNRMEQLISQYQNKIERSKNETIWRLEQLTLTKGELYGIGMAVFWD
ncbi:MAG: hypothetical protein ACLTCI_04105 [[Clostridium] nexile]